MILPWMLSALLFTACVAIGAASADLFARAFGRPARWIWGTALAMGALWPVVAPLSLLVLPRLGDIAAILPAIQVVPEREALFGRSTRDAMEAAGRVLPGVWALASLLLAGRGRGRFRAPAS